MSEAERGGASRQDENTRLLAGRYRLGGVLGRGGMGTVWRAQDETLGRTVAVKELRFPSSIDEDEKRRLITRTLREAKAIARIRNNGAVTVFDVVDEDDRPWIVMELIEGKSLAEVIRQDGTLEPKRAAEVGLAILDVLRSAHREGILHRDVKPSNVLISDDGRVVLTDFGIAQVEGDPSVTSTGMLVGAPSYISPERARGHKPGPAADLWSLGGLLYAAVEGVPPYDKGSAIATLTAVMTEPVDEPVHAGPLRKVIHGLLAKDPAQRLDDAGARALLKEVIRAPDSSADEPADATKVVALPPVPEQGAGRARPGGSGTKPGDSAEGWRGALRSVRKAAAGAGTAAAAAGTAAGSEGGGAARGGETPKGEGAAKTTAASPSTSASSGPSSSRSSSSGPASSVSSPSASSSSGSGAVAGRAAGAAAAGNPASGRASSGWPEVPPPDLPPRPAPRASITDVVPRRRLIVIAVAVVVVLAVLGTVLALWLGGGDEGGSDGRSGDTRSATSPAATGSADGAEGSGTRTDGEGSETASESAGSGGSAPEGDADASEGSGEDGGEAGADNGGDAGSGSGSGSGSDDIAVSTYEHAQGFSIGLPEGWQYRSTDAAGARFTGPDGQRLLVGWTTTPKDDAEADWRSQEKYMTRPQYQRIRIEAVDYRGWNAADWEFTYMDGGTKNHVVNRGFVVDDSLGHALMYTAKDAEWDGDLRKDTWRTFTETFRPKS
ncbi:protein kinase domain-containing protein [Streptomyces sp. CRN 30]|uniref:protein kinase domain-containing protein n=1 Tax=Streptomyces sp. CRN 30 TaxID=3075613 RepID=UPI002A8223F6|nr:protein kinase [Streptomyces sp. CRN 30]